VSRRAEILLEYQNYIEAPPVQPAQLYAQASSSDGVTVNHWAKIWTKNIKANKAKFGSFKEHSIGKLWGTLTHMPAIVAGAGPSLKVNGALLKDRNGMALISCLHNYHFFEDQGISPDFYVTLDAGPVVIEEVSEGGSKTPEEYWASTKGKKLLAFIGTDPALFDKWQGEVYFFNAPVPDTAYMKELEAIEPFHVYVSSGGNVLGACLYIAKGILGACTTAFVGADFAFSYDKKFHGWDSKYDASLGYVLKAIDVYGNKVLTWQSYANFKAWFDWVAVKIPGIYINCTEGGTFGAYPDGNIMAVRQLELKDFLRMHNLHEELRGQCEYPETGEKKVLF